MTTMNSTWAVVSARVKEDETRRARKISSTRIKTSQDTLVVSLTKIKNLWIWSEVKNQVEKIPASDSKITMMKTSFD